MENFYRRIHKEQPGADALREAQPDIKTKYPEPLFWAPSSTKAIQISSPEAATRGRAI
jgi:hypothetical protein